MTIQEMRDELEKLTTKNYSTLTDLQKVQFCGLSTLIGIMESEQANSLKRSSTPNPKG
ncbi:MAG TPA: hypothetical protein VGK64_12630 [Bryobacteraceae bacterium]